MNIWITSMLLSKEEDPELYKAIENVTDRIVRLSHEFKLQTQWQHGIALVFVLLQEGSKYAQGNELTECRSRV